MNELLMIMEVLVVFTLVLLCHKLFGKYGLIGWIGIASVLAEIQVIKSIDIFGISGTLGNVLFASNFLVTDILTEVYGAEYAKKGVFFGVFSIITFIIISQFTILFIPNDIDTVSDALKQIFTISPRVCISSLVMYLIANYIDVIIYDKLKRRDKNKRIWFRNNFSTIVCNSLENFFFVFFAFIGLYSFKDIMLIALSTTLIEVIIAFMDTPFLYIAKKTS